MALDRWTVQAIAAEEAEKALKIRNIEDFITATIDAEMDTKIKKYVDGEFSVIRESIKIINEQQNILKRAIERINESDLE